MDLIPIGFFVGGYVAMNKKKNAELSRMDDALADMAAYRREPP